MRQPLLQLEVIGKPESAGSKKSIPARRKDGSYVFGGNGRLVVNTVEDNKKAKPWMQQVAWTARSEWGSRPLLTDPLAVEFIFVRERPKGHYRTGRFAGVLKDWALLAFPTTKPDVLKQARAVEDALSGIVYRDDAQIVDERIVKVYGAPQRVVIRIYEADPALAGLDVREDEMPIPELPEVEQPSLLAA